MDIHISNLTRNFQIEFDANNPNWSPDEQHRELFVKGVCIRLNAILNARGYVFLNEALDALGFPRIFEGQLLGWAGDLGEGLVRVYWEHDEEVEEQINILFKTDGVILDELPRHADVH